MYKNKINALYGNQSNKTRPSVKIYESQENTITNPIASYNQGNNSHVYGYIIPNEREKH